MKPEFQIFDNFLSPQDFTNIKNEITALEFQWYFSPHVDIPEESPTPRQFVHTVSVSYKHLKLTTILVV